MSLRPDLERSAVGDGLLERLRPKRGHFRLESGHHGDLWLDLALLCWRPNEVWPFAAELARRLEKFEVEVVCGPLVDGAFVALMVAMEMKVEFCYSEPIQNGSGDELFPIRYKMPYALREKVAGRRVAIVNDVINAGSAVRGTLFDLKECGAEVVAIGSLLVLGSAVQSFADESRVPLVSLGKLPNRVWAPKDCPLCHSGMALE